MRAILALIACIAFAGAAQAQPFPDRPVHIIVGFAAGGGPDVIARAVANQLGADLGRAFYVENRPGANGTIATSVVAKSAADGYTLLYTSDSIAPTPFVYKSLPYDVFHDLEPIATVGILDGLLMLVNPSSPAHNVDEFIAYAKKNRVLYGSPGIGLSMEHVPFKGTSEVAAALLGGSIDVMFSTPPSVVALAQDGKLRAIAFTGSKPFPELPNVPLMKASVPAYPPVPAWGIFFAPANTPTEIIDKLNTAIRHALDAPAVAQVVQKAGYIPDGRSPAQTAAFFREQVDAAGKAVEAAGIQPN
jgi:tripartite-type tricarboxylate transporter receptor subunit TctC